MKKLVDHSAGIVYYFPDYIDEQSLIDDVSRFRYASFIIQENKLIKCRSPLIELIESYISKDENITAFDTSYFSLSVGQDSQDVRVIVVNAPRQNGDTPWLMKLYNILDSVDGGLPVHIYASKCTNSEHKQRYNKRIADRMIVLCDETLPQQIPLRIDIHFG